jgi:hypothetical protein
MPLFNFKLQRAPTFDLDLNDFPGLRASILDQTSDLFSISGHLVGELLFFAPDQLFTGQIEGIAEPGQESILALILHKQGEDTVKRRFRRGEIAIPTEDGRRRAVALLELLPDNRWWVAWRLVGTGQLEVGVWHGEWQYSEGQGIETLLEPLQEWIDMEKAELVSMEQTEFQHGGGDDIRMAIAEAKGTLPDDPRAIAQFIGKLLDKELLAKGLNYLLIFAFRPNMMERWEVRGQLSCPMEDLIRAIAAFGEEAQAVAVVHPAVVDLQDGVRYRCFTTVVEHKGQLGHRLLPFTMENGQPTPLKDLYQLHPIPEGGQWLGVPPAGTVTLFPKAPMLGGEVPES